MGRYHHDTGNIPRTHGVAVINLRTTYLGEYAQVDDVIQIAPEHDDVFGGTFAIVQEVKGWGVSLCSVAVPGKGMAYFRVPHGRYVVVGRAMWSPEFPHDSEG